MADHTILAGGRSKHKTLSGTTIDKVTVVPQTQLCDVINRVGTANLSVTFARGADPANPVQLADDTEIVPPGGKISLNNNFTNDLVIKILGNSNEYSVIAR